MVRFSRDDYERLQILADGAALATYIRAQALREPLKAKRRSKATVEDAAALAQVLGLLGQSRIANNLNQLAYHANIGSLPVDDHLRKDFNEAYQYVRAMRDLLMQALGRCG